MNASGNVWKCSDQFMMGRCHPGLAGTRGKQTGLRRSVAGSLLNADPSYDNNERAVEGSFHDRGHNRGAGRILVFWGCGLKGLEVSGWGWESILKRRSECRAAGGAARTLVNGKTVSFECVRRLLDGLLGSTLTPGFENLVFLVGSYWAIIIVAEIDGLCSIY